MRRCCLLTALLATAWLADPAAALIERLYSLHDVLNDSTHVLVGRLALVDAERQIAVIDVERAAKGRKEFDRVKVSLRDAAEDHRACLLRRLKEKNPVLLFCRRDGNGVAALAYAGGAWFQLFLPADQPGPQQNAWWQFTVVELHMTRTYRGPAAELVKLTDAVIAGRAEAPPTDAKAPSLDLKADPAADDAPPSNTFALVASLPCPAADGPGQLAGRDIDGDGRPELFAARPGGDLLLRLEQRGHAWACSVIKPPHAPQTRSRSADLADLDADGRLDLLTTDAAGALWTQSEDGFAAAALLPAAADLRSVAWIDADNDGLPDALLADAASLRLFRNAGAGPQRFAEITDKAGLADKGPGDAGGKDDARIVSLVDADNDGRTDLFYNLGSGRLYHNRGDGTFGLSPKCGIDLPGGGDWPRRLAWADYDNDGDADLFVPAPGKARLYRNNGDGSFTDVSAAAGDLAKADAPSVAAAWGDVDGDGNLDLFVCHTRGGGRLYLGDGKGGFRDATEATGVAKLSPADAAVRAAVLADLDGDGRLDLAIDLADRVVVAISSLPQADGRAALSVRLAVARGATGATARLADTQGRLLGSRAEPLSMHWAVPSDVECRLLVRLADGRTATPRFAPTARPQSVVLDDEDFRAAPPAPH
ncbi:MAG: hypothetical protein BIFFINMI_02840 [Phycisphaerae bacterium]|nr:hypothetical protein [Phycisphaerae bacterium]